MADSPKRNPGANGTPPIADVTLLCKQTPLSWIFKLELSTQVPAGRKSIFAQLRKGGRRKLKDKQLHKTQVHMSGMLRIQFYLSVRISSCLRPGPNTLPINTVYSAE